jgi:hypothetical protein
VKLSLSPRATAFLITAVSIIVYNANGRPITSGDSLPARLIPFSILLDGTVTLDRFFVGRVDPAKFENASLDERNRYFYLASRHGRLYSKYPIALPILITPLYMPLALVKRDWSDLELHVASAVMEKIVASLIAALSVAAMFTLLSALTDRRIALALTFAFAFGSTTWTTSSQALWQHGAGVLFMLLALSVVVKRPQSAALAGVFAALAVAIRPSNIFFWIALLSIDTWIHRSIRRAARIALPGVIIGGMVAAYNVAVFGNLRGGYGLVTGPFSGAQVSGLAGILFSPSRGLLIYSPFLIAGFIGLWMALRKTAVGRSPVYAVAALFVICDLILIASWKSWWGGWSYGPRIVTEATAMLVVLAVPAAEKFRAHRWARVSFVALTAYSVAVQALGAVAYRPIGGWNSFPVSVDKRPDRLWDWRDSQILRTAKFLN